MKKEQTNITQTNIVWVSVHDSLPETGTQVLTLNEKNEVMTQTWSPESGWEFRCCGLIKFWSNFNIPK